MRNTGVRPSTSALAQMQQPVTRLHQRVDAHQQIAQDHAWRLDLLTLMVAALGALDVVLLGVLVALARGWV